MSDSRQIPRQNIIVEIFKCLKLLKYMKLTIVEVLAQNRLRKKEVGF